MVRGNGVRDSSCVAALFYDGWKTDVRVPQIRCDCVMNRSREIRVSDVPGANPSSRFESVRNNLYLFAA